MPPPIIPPPFIMSPIAGPIAAALPDMRKEIKTVKNSMRFIL